MHRWRAAGEDELLPGSASGPPTAASSDREAVEHWTESTIANPQPSGIVGTKMHEGLAGET